MPQFTVNPARVDPYKRFTFRVRWDNRYVAGVTRVSALTRTTDVVEHREGSDPNTVHASPGVTRFAPITLERGVTHDTEFETWANQVWSAGTPGVSLADFRKDLGIELYNEAGQIVLAYRVHRAWVSEYQAVGDLDAGASAVAIERLVLTHEGWERDLSVVEPEERSH